MVRSPFHPAQCARGARFGEVNGLELPLDYGDWLAEHHAVREACGLLDRSTRGRLVVTGEDRLSWLQGMLSNDLRPLEAGAPSVQACALDATGHLLSDVIVAARPDSLLLDVPRENVEALFHHLERFIVTERVEIVEQSGFLAGLSVQGPAADESALRAVVGGSALLVPADHTGEGGFDLYLPVADAEAAWIRLVDSGIAPVGETAAETLRIEAGIPRWGIDMDATTIPLECGLGPSHISHTKGCYLGQEVIHRIYARGHTNRTLVGFLVDGPELPTRGDRVLWMEGDTAREVGWTTSATHSPSLAASIALGYVRREHAAPGTHLRTQNSVPLTVTLLPFLRSRS